MDNIHEFSKRLHQDQNSELNDTYMCLMYKRDGNKNIQDCKTVVKGTKGMQNHLRDYHSTYKHYGCQLCEEKFQRMILLNEHKLFAHSNLLINNQILANNKGKEDAQIIKIENINDLHEMKKFQDKREQQFFCDKFKNDNGSKFGQETESLIIREQNT